MAVGTPAGRRTDTPWRVAWTRGRTCRPLSEVLSDGPPLPVEPDLAGFCISAKIDVLVARRFTSFDLVPVVVPSGVDLEHLTGVVAAVADGPHSEFAATVAARTALNLGLPAELATVYRNEAEHPMALRRLARFAQSHPALEQRAVQASSAASLLELLSSTTLLVLGSPGGSWLQRQLFGPGHRLKVSAPGGALVVRSAPRRCFQAADDAVGAGAGLHLAAGEARRLYAQPVIPVADAGRLVGIVRLASLAGVPDAVELGEVMESPIAVNAGEPLEVVHELSEFLDGGSVPVVDGAGMLIGTIPTNG